MTASPPPDSLVIDYAIMSLFTLADNITVRDRKIIVLPCSVNKPYLPFLFSLLIPFSSLSFFLSVSYSHPVFDFFLSFLQLFLDPLSSIAQLSAHFASPLIPCLTRYQMFLISFLPPSLARHIVLCLSIWSYFLSLLVSMSYSPMPSLLFRHLPGRPLFIPAIHQVIPPPLSSSSS